MPAEDDPSRSITLSRRTLVIAATAVLAVIVAAAVVITVLVVGDDDKKPRAGSATSPVAAGGRGTCPWPAVELPAKSVKSPPTSVPTTGTVTVALTTSLGKLTFTLDRAAAPCTVASFVSLAGQGYFDNSPCHRVTTTSGVWVVQCGDPSGSGSGQPGYSIPDEATGNETYPAGTIAMARFPTPNSGGSQFFIVYKDSPKLAAHLGTQQYTVFGSVTKGLDLVKRVGAAGARSGDDGRPKLPLQLLTVKAA